jgi:hypothetical protein
MQAMDLISFVKGSSFMGSFAVQATLPNCWVL